MPRGRFIVFEGADRSGKTTQTKRYVEFLRKAGIPTADDLPWRFPDRSTHIGQMINSYLKCETELNDHALHLLFSANRWERVSRIQKALIAGETVVVDRYAFSGVAYSTAKGLPFEWCKSSDAGLPAPDVVIYLDLSPEVARKRGDYGTERYENLQMQTKVANVFTKLRDESWRIVDADADEDTVFARILGAITEALDNTPLDKLNTLW